MATKFTQALAERIVGYVKAGAYIETAAASAGISKVTLYAWLRKGATAKNGPYLRFAQDVERALATDELRGVTTIERIAMATAQRTVQCPSCKTEFATAIPVAPTNVQLAALTWKMERKFPDRYGSRMRVDTDLRVQGELETTLEECRGHMKRESYVDFLRALATVRDIRSLAT